jgi:hypothetical protein
MKQTIFSGTNKNGDKIEHKIDFIYEPPANGFEVTILIKAKGRFKIENICDSFNDNGEVQIRHISLKTLETDNNSISINV